MGPGSRSATPEFRSTSPNPLQDKLLSLCIWHFTIWVFLVFWYLILFAHQLYLSTPRHSVDTLYNVQCTWYFSTWVFWYLIVFSSFRSTSSWQLTWMWSVLIFWRFSKGGEGSFQILKFCCRFFVFRGIGYSATAQPPLIRMTLSLYLPIHPSVWLRRWRWGWGWGWWWWWWGWERRGWWCYQKLQIKRHFTLVFVFLPGWDIEPNILLPLPTSIAKQRGTLSLGMGGKDTVSYFK